MPSPKRWLVWISALTITSPNPSVLKSLRRELAGFWVVLAAAQRAKILASPWLAWVVLRLGDLVVDTNRRQVSRGGERIALTYTEFSLLELLFREPGRVVPRAEILEQLWGYPPRRTADLRVVDVYVARLRGKLEPDPRNPELILTVRGTGYASQRLGELSAAGA